MDFVSFMALLRGQVKATKYISGGIRLKFWSRVVLFVLSAAAIIFISIKADWSIQSSDGLLTAIAIFAGGFLTSFSHLASMRQKLSARQGVYGEAEAPERDLVDVAVTNLLTATWLSALTAVLLVLGSNLFSNEEGHIVGVMAASIWAGSFLTFSVFLSTIPTLYVAYAQLNNIPSALDGSDATE